MSVVGEALKRRKRMPWLFGTVVARSRTIGLCADVPWSFLTYFLYQRLYALHGHDAVRLLWVYLPFAVLKTALLSKVLTHNLRPVDVFLQSKSAPDEVFLPAATILFRFRDWFPLVIATAWGLLCPACTLTMELLFPEVMPPLGVALPISVLLGAAQFISTWMHGVTGTPAVFGPELPLMADEAERRGLPIPVTQVPHSTVLLLVASGFAVTPTLWMTCIAYMMWFRTVTHVDDPGLLQIVDADRGSLFYFMVLMLLWVPPVALLMSRGVVYPVRQIAVGVQRAAEAGQAAAAGRVPVYAIDEMGQLASSVNFMVRRLAEADEQIRAQMKDLETLDELKNQFLRVAAHELKTPVAIIKGYSQLLLRRAADLPSELQALLHSMDRGTNRITLLVEDFLFMTELQIGRPPLVFQPLDLTVLVQKVVDTAAAATPEQRIRLVAESPAWVNGDRLRLEHVIDALLNNAVKFSQHRGEIEVTVAVEGDEVIASVKDEGIGIPADKQARIFESFYRAHTDTPYDYGGMGVGLYLAKETVLRHGGTMAFVSAEGKGSTFTVRLPRCA